MRAAIDLAKKGTGWTNPNPLVGSVIVKDNQIIGQGWHHKYGDLHAERDALRDCLERGNDASGAHMFVTLEPCAHTGKQPPCVEAIVQAGIKKVTVGSRDPNPLVSGKGAAFLRANGVEVEEDFLREECDALNFIFFHYITTRTPFVALKYAMTADGKIATVSGASKWISCQESRDYVHQLRSQYSCIICGIGTALADDPLLTCRIEGGKNPTRIICDSNLRLPLESKLVQTARDVPTIVACRDPDCSQAQDSAAPKVQDFLAKEKALQEKGVQIIRAGSSSVDLRLLLKALGERNLDSVLVEGGSKINFSFLEQGLAQKLYCFVAPKIFGGAAPSPVGGQGVLEVSDAFGLAAKDARKIGSDFLIEYDITERVCSQE
ncbi:MAG: bifunctional diaminohydroxyphosphoribosylaminopyrimidine deaminase/5-amino-6-(5-phosphoribosylamino)uracil reductase RibD [Treponema sp.]|nr:bifunctional diaminohydroxyphosphoribosylaminopyrimidine deaminase/5-amino-6-(5-phosphoribosylamino)uracil reductase RibD [Treponema sp.]